MNNRVFFKSPRVQLSVIAQPISMSVDEKRNVSLDVTLTSFTFIVLLINWNNYGTNTFPCLEKSTQTNFQFHPCLVLSTLVN